MAKTGLRGFTLLEMLVVMVIMGLVTALALPAMQRWHDAIQVKAQAAVVLDALRTAAFSAGASRRTLEMDSNSFRTQGQVLAAAKAAAQTDTTQAPEGAVPVAKAAGLVIELPAGWQVERVQAARFLANGLCAPGMVALKTANGEPVTIEVRGPICGVELAALGGRG